MSDIEQAMQAGPVGNPTGNDKAQSDPNVTYVWIVPVDMEYVKSLCSLIEIITAALGLIAFICCDSGRTVECDSSYASTYNFFDSMAMSTFWTMLLWWTFNVVFLTIINRNGWIKVVSWRLGELIVLGIFGVLFFIADIAIAAQPCGKDSNRAAAAFGFFTTFGLGCHFLLSFRVFRVTEQPMMTQRREDAQQGTDMNKY